MAITGATIMVPYLHSKSLLLLWRWGGHRWTDRQMSCWGLIVHDRVPGGRFKKAYELLNLRALKFAPVNRMHIFQCMNISPKSSLAPRQPCKLPVVCHSIAWYSVGPKISVNMCWCHTVNFGLGNGLLPNGNVARQHQAITWASVDLSSVRSSATNLRAISPQVPQPSNTRISLKITY